MAFDLVQYFVEQIETQKPELLKDHTKPERRKYISEINALTLGKLITEWRNNPEKIYNEINDPDELYILEVVRHLVTSPDNQSTLDRVQLEQSTTEVFQLQLTELKQLHDTGSHNINSIQELLIGQIEHLSGQADDWVWTTNSLIELKGSKPVPEEEISLDETMKEFNQMLHQHSTHEPELHPVAATPETPVPAWAKVLEPVVALAILYLLYSSATQIFA